MNDPRTTQVRRSGATAAAGGDTATSLSVSSRQDAPHLCTCDPELLALRVFDLSCRTHGLIATLGIAVRSIREADRG